MNAQTASPDQLTEFIRSAKGHGVDDEFIVALLRKNGWSERRIFATFTGYYGRLLGAPLPTRSGRPEDARDAFYYVLNFLTLGFWTVALGHIFYTLIARYLPDPGQASPYWSLRDQLAWQVATVIVTFPVFAYLHQLIGRELRRRPDLAESGVRKWLTYVALVIAACVVIADGIWFLDALLIGELTLRFMLDSCVLLVLGGGVFGYYLATIDPKRETQ